MMAFTAAVEPLRSANRMSGHELFSWHVVTRDGKPVEASNGFTIMPESGIAGAAHFPTMIVCAGIDVQLFRDKEVYSWLRRLARSGTRIGALCTGSHILAGAVWSFCPPIRPYPPSIVAPVI